MIAVAAVATAERGDVERFYRTQLGRAVSLDPADEPLAARDDRAIVAAARLHHRAGTLVLRTMVVADGRRRTGIGTRLLDAVDRAIGGRECYCFPWAHLEHFYGRIGFRRVDLAAVPRALADLLGDDCIPMRREARS
ncbi:MAG TPA: GNAT family N-acetyltransferase [Candidatus Limnocylindria bacterium]|nr:GNAT family N-acetyltransferase [Candidatus Limnocylindria bacterium]